jgi:hypothetical protein
MARRRLHGWRVFESIFDARSFCNEPLRAIQVEAPRGQRRVPETDILAALAAHQDRHHDPERVACTAVARRLHASIAVVCAVWRDHPELHGRPGRPRKSHTK